MRARSSKSFMPLQTNPTVRTADPTRLCGGRKKQARPSVGGRQTENAEPQTSQYPYC